MILKTWILMKYLNGKIPKQKHGGYRWINCVILKDKGLPKCI